ncbi:MAG: hypothetical protein DRJ41_04395 [Thermoprotei archaeon]|nr:MAG: hypothetical protein DRJ41_04395 [Thermoprotei archaeon]
MSPWVRPWWWRKPREFCDLCNRSLYGVKRYRVVVRLNGVELFRVYVCERCRLRVREWARRKGFRTRTKRMPDLPEEHYFF